MNRGLPWKILFTLWWVITILVASASVHAGAPAPPAARPKLERLKYAYEDTAIDQRLDALERVVDRGDRVRLLQQIGDHRFHEFSDSTTAAAPPSRG